MKSPTNKSALNAAGLFLTVPAVLNCAPDPPLPALFHRAHCLAMAWHCTWLRFAARPDSPSRLADYSKPLRDDDAAGGRTQAEPPPCQAPPATARKGGSGGAWRIATAAQNGNKTENSRNLPKFVKLRLLASVFLGLFQEMFRHMRLPE